LQQSRSERRLRRASEVEKDFEFLDDEPEEEPETKSDEEDSEDDIGKLPPKNDDKSPKKEDDKEEVEVEEKHKEKDDEKEEKEQKEEKAEEEEEKEEEEEEEEEEEGRYSWKIEAKPVAPSEADKYQFEVFIPSLKLRSGSKFGERHTSTQQDIPTDLRYKMEDSFPTFTTTEAEQPRYRNYSR
jgi:archaellum component FlaD/FlaE